MYYIALNVLHNMNSSRIMLYREMKKYFENQIINSDDEVFELGRKLGLADHVIKYEYDGCMYANFIVPQNDVKRLSEKAKVDFKLYDSELKYKLFEKMQKAKNTTLHEQKEKYKRLEQQENRVNNEHDKVFRKILSDKIEVTKFLNEQLKTNLKPEDIEQYNSSYINTLMQNEEADVVYKLKGKNEFFLIEHQSKVDYRMQFRILKYEMAIVESAIDEKECKKKDYLYPRVNAIVLYTGKQKWNVSKTFNEAQVTSILEKAIEFAKYILVDINNYTEEKLLETPSFMTKALLIEKAKDNEQIANYIEKIVEIINKDKENYSNNIKEIFKIMLTQIIKNKIGKEKTDEFLNKLNIGGDEDMMAVFETIQQDNKRIYRRGKKDGIVEGIKQGISQGIMENSIAIAKKLLSRNNSKEEVAEITGLKIEEIEKLQ